MSPFYSRLNRKAQHHHHLILRKQVDGLSPYVIAVDARDQHLAFVVVDEKSSDHGDALAQCSHAMVRNLQENQTEIKLSTSKTQNPRKSKLSTASVLMQILKLAKQGITPTCFISLNNMTVNDS